jgi:hypothetical protein
MTFLMTFTDSQTHWGFVVLLDKNCDSASIAGDGAQKGQRGRSGSEGGSGGGLGGGT